MNNAGSDAFGLFLGLFVLGSIAALYIVLIAITVARCL